MKKGFITATVLFGVMLVICLIYIYFNGHTLAEFRDYNCRNFATHEDAQVFFNKNGGSSTSDPFGLDRNSDGIACSGLPHAK